VNLTTHLNLVVSGAIRSLLNVGGGGCWDNLTFLYVSLRTIRGPMQCVECWPMPDRLFDANVCGSGQWDRFSFDLLGFLIFHFVLLRVVLFSCKQSLFQRLVKYFLLTQFL
jgi:hypothetical protein